jgi:hypothetical protein
MHLIHQRCRLTIHFMRGISAFRRNSLSADVVSIALQSGIRIPVHRVHAVVASGPSNTRRTDRKRSGNSEPAAIHLRHFRTPFVKSDLLLLRQSG